MGCLNILDEIIDFIYKKLKISNIVNNFLGNKRERPKTKTENNKLLFKRIPNKNNFWINKNYRLF